MIINENNIYQDIEPYLESLTFFSKLSNISNNLNQKYKQNNVNPNLPSKFESINEFIEYFKKKIIIDKKKDDDNEKEKKLYQENPQIIFSFFLDELHKIFKNNIKEEVNNQKIKEIEYNSIKAYNLFNEFIKKENSYISDLFFGEKEIIKYCNHCQNYYYIYKYLKYINLDLKQIEGIVSLEEIVNDIQNHYFCNLYCKKCLSGQKFLNTVKIKKKPEILIIIFYNHHKNEKIDFPINIYNKCYKLICAEVGIDKSEDNSFFISKICKKKKNNYKLLFKKDEAMFNLIKINKQKYLDEKAIKGKIPYVLFYKKIKEDTNEKDNSENEMSENIMIRITTLEGDSKYDKNNQIQFNLLNRKNINDDEEKNSINNIEIETVKKSITLFFRLVNDNKELNIDVEDSDKFINIIGILKSHYKLSENFINENNFIFNNEKIDFQKTPKELGIGPKSIIIIK